MASERRVFVTRVEWRLDAVVEGEGEGRAGWAPALRRTALNERRQESLGATIIEISIFALLKRCGWE